MMLEVIDLSISYSGRQVVHGISFNLDSGDTLGIVGESGSGKSSVGLALTRLLPEWKAHITGKVLFHRRDLLQIPEQQLRGIRGKEIAYVFQDALAALNPTMTVGRQIVEALVQHETISYSDAKEQVMTLMTTLGIHQRFDDYPFQFSGGMRQRVMMAIALICRPQLIVADEPTTALDEHIQQEIIDLLRTIQQDYRLSLLLISHDLDVIEQLCSHVLVMKDGKVVEAGTANQVLHSPTHPYTQQLLESARYCHR